MGLFDGAADGRPSSTADVARLLGAPIVLVVDASAMSRSVAAVVSGFARFDPTVEVAAVVLNRVGSDTHEALLREALGPVGIPVIGALRRDERFTWRDRHLGLVPVAEQADEVAASLDRLAVAVAAQVDVEAVMALARRAPEVATGPVALPGPGPLTGDGPPVRVAVAAGPAFTFTYTDTVEALEAGGAEVVAFDPRRDEVLPAAVAGLVAGGGFPEVYAAELAANRPLLDDVRRRVGTGTGIVTWAECGGLLWLCRSLHGHAMAGVVPADATMAGRLTLGYRTATTATETFLGPPGTELTGHEFHYSTVSPAGDALVLASRWGERREGWAGPGLLATYLHHHPGGDPSAVAAFLTACRHAAARLGHR